MRNLATLNAAVAIVDGKGRPTLAFQKQYQTNINELRGQVQQIADILGLTFKLDAAVTTAQTAANAAQTAADTAQSAAKKANAVASLTNSGVTGLTLTATDAGTDATITVSAHTRVYGDGTTLAVGGASLPGLAYSTGYYVYYDDPTRADTTPSFQTTTSEATAAQTGDRHLVGYVLTPAAAAPPNNGERVRPPGVGNLKP